MCTSLKVVSLAGFLLCWPAMNASGQMAAATQRQLDEQARIHQSALKHQAQENARFRDAVRAMEARMDRMEAQRQEESRAADRRHAEMLAALGRLAESNRKSRTEDEFSYKPANYQKPAQAKPTNDSYVPLNRAAAEDRDGFDAMMRERMRSNFGESKTRQQVTPYWSMGRCPDCGGCFKLLVTSFEIDACGQRVEHGVLYHD